MSENAQNDAKPFRWDWVVFLLAVAAVVLLVVVLGKWAGGPAFCVAYATGRWDESVGARYRR